MTHQFIICADEILTLDTTTERTEARQAMRDAGIDSLPVLEGEAGGDGEPTGETLTAEHDARDLPGDEQIAEMLATLIDPESDDDMRAEVIEELGGAGCVEASALPAS